MVPPGHRAGGVSVNEYLLLALKDAENARAISAASDHWGKSDLAQSKMRAMTAYCRSSGDIKKVPDPYYGGPQVSSTEVPKTSAVG